MALPTTLKRLTVANMWRTVTKATATPPATTTDDLFTISTGRVEIYTIVGEVTTIIQSQLCNMWLNSNPTTGSTARITQDLDIDGDEVGHLYGLRLQPFGDPYASPLINQGLSGATAVGGVTLVVAPGTIEVETDATSTGSIKWTCMWRPFDEGAGLVTA